jgi:hypothetical protein
MLRRETSALPMELEESAGRGQPEWSPRHNQDTPWTHAGHARPHRQHKCTALDAYPRSCVGRAPQVADHGAASKWSSNKAPDAHVEVMQGTSQAASDRAGLTSMLRELADMTRTLASASVRATREELAAWSDGTRTTQYMDTAGGMRGWMEQTTTQGHTTRSRDAAPMRTRHGRPATAATRTMPPEAHPEARATERGHPLRGSVLHGARRSVAVRGLHRVARRKRLRHVAAPNRPRSAPAQQGWTSKGCSMTPDRGRRAQEDRDRLPATAVSSSRRR